jgi:hypothetical protein
VFRAEEVPVKNSFSPTAVCDSDCWVKDE